MQFKRGFTSNVEMNYTRIVTAPHTKELFITSDLLFRVANSSFGTKVLKSSATAIINLD